MIGQITVPAAGNANQTVNAPSSVRVYNMTGYYNKQFALDVENFRNSGRLKFGYANLDAVTNLYPGLYVLGAISSLGKTTFIHQTAEQIAEAGTHVLFFSLEQSALELASKSIARSVAKENAENGLSSLQIRRSDLSSPVILSAINRCIAYSGRITVIECSFRATIDDIANTIHRYIKQNKVKPVVIIDYLQIIQPAPAIHMTTKDLVDYHVRRLKELQTDYQITMIVISSLNRQNYTSAIDFESYKESGGIEYTADVIWGLQLKCIHDELFSKQNKTNEKRQMIMEAKKSTPRKIELICLKNRFGISSYTCNFDYYPKFDLFKPDLTGLNLSDVSFDTADTDGFMAIPEGLEPELPWPA